jgi:hypothetical protein
MLQATITFQFSVQVDAELDSMPAFIRELNQLAMQSQIVAPLGLSQMQFKYEATSKPSIETIKILQNDDNA